VIFTGAAIATLAALMGVTYDKWSSSPAPGTQVEQAAAPAGKPAETTAAPTAEEAVAPSTELASVAPEPPASATSSAEPPLAPADPSAKAPDLSVAGPEAPADDSKPSFDTVRIAPDGSAVIAGRGLPNSNVTVMLNGEPLGSVKSDTGGAWVFVPEEPVPPGDHELTLQMLTDGAAAIYSDQSVALKVPDRAMGEPLVVLSDPDQPSRVMQKPPADEPEAQQAEADEPSASQDEPVAAAPASSEKGDAAPASASMALTLSTVDYNDAGDIIFSGTADANSGVRLYVDNAPVGDAAVAADGTWSFAGQEQIRPGTHTLRVDQLRGDGTVAERIELPFMRAKPQQVLALNQSVQQKMDEADAPPGAVEEPAAVPRPAAEETPAPESAAAEPDAQTEAVVPNAPAAETPVVAAEAPAEAAEPPEPAPSAIEESSKTELAAVAPAPVADAPAADAPAAADAEPQATAAGGDADESAAAAKPEAAIVMPHKGQIVIQPGNNLWRISRVLYGRGIEYTVIYEANRNQIRDPNLIYPGQIFATPGAELPAMIDPASQTPLATTGDAPTSAQ
jgi:nucleoid-associated protein YgaU